MDRRSFLRATGLGLIALPAARVLTACSLPPTTDQTTTSPATSLPTTTTLPPSTVATTLPTQPATTSAAASPAARLTVICRGSWGAAPPRTGMVAHTIDRITVHHTAVLLDDNRQAPSRLRGHQQYHLSLGWPDLAYHYAVDRSGNVYEGRSTDFRGDTATDYDPTGHLLVVAEGDFDHQTIPDAQVGGVAALLAWAVTRFGVATRAITGHRDWTSTSCPGADFYSIVADGTLAARAAALVETGGVELVTVCDAQGEALIGAIEAGQQLPGVSAGFFLRNSNTPGPADEVIEFGEPGWIPVSGDFGP